MKNERDFHLQTQECFFEWSETTSGFLFDLEGDEAIVLET
jgi:hypothetical protein